LVDCRDRARRKLQIIGEKNHGLLFVFEPDFYKAKEMFFALHPIYPGALDAQTFFPTVSRLLLRGCPDLPSSSLFSAASL
jgi:hypothetical protein